MLEFEGHRVPGRDLPPAIRVPQQCAFLLPSSDGGMLFTLHSSQTLLLKGKSLMLKIYKTIFS
jgi:hypothetical protein